MKTIHENNNFPMKKQKLNDEHLDNPSLVGFGTFNFDNSKVIIKALRIGYRHLDLAENYKKSKNKVEKVGSIFSASQVKEAVNNDDCSDVVLIIKLIMNYKNK